MFAMFNRFSTRSPRLLTVTATALSLVMGSAYAASSDDTPGPGWHGHGMLRQISQLHDPLHLNAAQEQQWQTALATTQQNRQAARASHEQMKQQFQALQQQPILDLNALHAAQQQAQQQAAQRREQTIGAWLAVYNGLDDQQKTLVSTALKQHFARMEARHGKMRKLMKPHGPATSAAAAAPAASAPVVQP
ncbi:periplasmic heavy metal sensor [Paraburkholderia hayleyella]|uniref:periplasmic heavy metal sensor n=1 Tax=Paraburkholderia hayleyella TaxID=2152889 RepID=UPI001FEA7551|nr:periplasmic heavy metal sensor [Paraburkholderia hayleyella]